MTGEQATFLAQQFAQLMEQELPTTVKVLKAVPDDVRDYRPDGKSRSAWDLVTHIAQADVWFLDSIIAGAFTFDADKARAQLEAFGSVADVVAYYEKEVPDRIARVRRLSVEELTRSVSFGGDTRPAVSFLGLANNHGIHHRGQLAAYLRAMGSKVPAIYGSSADESF